jgi:hypothetical protein
MRVEHVASYGYKVIFSTFSKNRLGFWLRYTLTSGVKGSKACLWLSIFKPGAPRGVVACYSLGGEGGARVLEGGEALIGDSMFSLSRGIGRARLDGFEWDIVLKPLEPPVNPIPLALRLLRRRSKYVMLSPLALFSGSVRFGGEIFNVEDYAGMVGFIESSRYLHGWVWAHCSGFKEDPGGWFDLLVASPSEGRMVAFGIVKADGMFIRLGGLMGENFRGESDLGFLEYTSKPRGSNISLRVEAAREDIIVAVYEDPVEGYRYCHNSEVASSTLTVSTRVRERTYSCQGRTFYEIVTPRMLDQGLPVVELISNPRL